jgi:hypothetical protein
VITLRKNTKLSNGEPVPEKYIPKLFQRDEDGVLQDITQSVLPANGSKGALAVEHYDGKMGPVARLKNVLVTDLIEYQKQDSDGDTGFDDSPAPAPVRTEAKVKPKTKTPAPVDDLDDPDLPF